MPSSKDQSARSAKLVDEQVGKNIRRRRTQLGMTQEALSQALRISYQQVQKYEAGTNRISASRLYEIALVFETEVGAFFEGLDQGKTHPQMQASSSRSTIEIAQNFSAIRSPAIKAALANLVRILGSGPENED